MKKTISILLAVCMLCAVLTGCGAPQEPEVPQDAEVQPEAEVPQEPETPVQGLQPAGSMELKYADQFQVDYYEGGYKLISISEGDRFLVVPEGKELPADAPEGAMPLYQPLNNIYLAATASMCLFDSLGHMDAVTLSGTKQDSWYLPSVVQAMEEGKILFAGKYSEPDYELILSHNCPLAVESTMINRAPEAKAKLQELGVHVLVDHSGMESHPLGRSEWIKLYGALFNEEEKAEALFEEQVARLEEVMKEEDTGKTAVFFNVSPSGYVVTRKSSDYISRMIEMAGGHYVFEDLGDPEEVSATVKMEMEAFFAAAKDADYILYNSTLVGELGSLDELIEQNALLAEFKAVQNGNVWCTTKQMYQEMGKLGEVVQSFHQIFSGEADELEEVPFLFRVR